MLQDKTYSEFGHILDKQYNEELNSHQLSAEELKELNIDEYLAEQEKLRETQMTQRRRPTNGTGLGFGRPRPRQRPVEQQNYTETTLFQELSSVSRNFQNGSGSSVRNRFRNFSALKKAKLHLIMRQLSDNLATAITNKHANFFTGVSEQKKYNMLYTVICFGETMYNASIVDPEFCTYMFDEHQDVYDWLS